MNRLVGVAVLVLATTGADAQTRPRAVRRAAAVPEVVKTAIRAARTLRYSGTRVVEFVSGADRKKHVEYILKDGPRSRVWFPDDSPFAGQVIVEKGGKRFHFFPDRNIVETSDARGDDAYKRFVQAIKNGRGGRLVESNGGRIAGIGTRQVTVQDGEGNVVQRLWIDPRTGMVLRRDLLDAVGALAGSYEFRAVNFSPAIRGADFDITRRGANRRELSDRIEAFSRKLGTRAFGIAPAKGYRLTAARVLAANRTGATLVLTYRGPLGVVTLFQTKAPINGARLRRLAAGRYRTHTWTQNGLNFALVGDMDVAELRKIAGLVSVQ